jgi:hypothetical protein
MPVREPLPLRLPREIAEQAAASEAGELPGDPAGVTESGSTDEPARSPAPAGRGTSVGRRRPSPRPRRS